MKTCPSCGASNKPIAKACTECGAALEEQKFDFDADQSKLDAANAGVPPAPKAPGAPKTPSAPAAPKPPQ